MKKNRDSLFEFECSNKKFHANVGIIGINENMDVSKGYDGYIMEVDDLTKEEKLELANYMINLWEKFKSSIK